MLTRRAAFGTVPCVIARLASEAWLVAIQIGLSLGMGLMVGRTPLRRLLAGTLLIVALALPFLADPSPITRVAITLIALVAMIKGSLIATSKAEWLTPTRRIWQVLVPFDVRLTKRVTPGLEAGSVTRILVAAAVIAVTLWYGVARSGHLPGQISLVAQLLCALFFAYSLMELAGEMIRSVHRLAGIHVDPLQRDPVLACSVTEFWGERWNLPMTRWLNEFFFRTLARTGHAAAGVVLAFVVSTALHGWLFYAAIGWWGALLASSFFLVQIPAVLLERKLGIRKWPIVLRRLWTLGFLVGTSPLFVLPMIRGLEMQLAGK